MNAREFNAIYDAEIVKPLEKAGFLNHRRSLFLERKNTVLALIRFTTRSDSLLQRTNLMLCLRHRFLRELTQLTVPDGSWPSINDYPFKQRPSIFDADAVTRWIYRPINLGVRSEDHDRVSYGKTNHSDEVRVELRTIARNTLQSGTTWLVRLPPAEARRQILEHGEDAWCERLWVEDYDRFLAEAEI